jgi:hypothetical protein
MIARKISVILFFQGIFSLVRAQVSGDLIPFRRGEYWGYCTPDKKIVIEPVYDFADWFRDGLALVSKGCRNDCVDIYDGVMGFIDNQGREVVALRFTSGGPFQNGKAYVSDGERYYSVDKSGQLTSVEERAYNPASPQSLPIPAGFKRVGDEAIFPKSAFQGYMSATGTAYWEDPETAFLLAIETFGERHPDYDKAFVRLHTDQTLVTRGAVGTRLSPGLALVSNKDGRPETEIYIPLETLPAGVDDHAYVFLIPDFNKVKPLLQYLGSDDGDKKLLFTRSYLIPYDSVKEGLLFRIYQKGILFTSTDFNLPILDYSHSLRELQMRDGELSILSRMAGDIQMTARNMKKQGDSQNYLIEGKDNPYQGKYLFDVMEKVTPREVRTFLEYVEARPFRYMGGRHKISEAFATWVYNGAPRVVKR